MRRLATVLTVCIAFAFTIGIGTAGSSEGTLRQRLLDLAAENGFTIRGLELVDAESPAPPARGGGVKTQIASLLADYNFVLVQDGAEGVRRVVITSRKVPVSALPQHAAIRTTRRGEYHFVEARLSGPRGPGLRIQLLVDTGASMLVLPSSMIDALGYALDDLQPGVAQTANGKVDAYVASLDTVQVGAVVAHDVGVSFVDDDKLGGQGLLGMSFLGRFKLTIDDSRNRILLTEP